MQRSRFFLGDLVVTEAQKGKGIGEVLLIITIEEAKDLQCTGIMWQVLDWNQLAIDFYKKYDAHFNQD